MSFCEPYKISSFPTRPLLSFSSYLSFPTLKLIWNEKNIYIFRPWRSLVAKINTPVDYNIWLLIQAYREAVVIEVEAFNEFFMGSKFVGIQEFANMFSTFIVSHFQVYRSTFWILYAGDLTFFFINIGSNSHYFWVIQFMIKKRSKVREV